MAASHLRVHRLRTTSGLDGKILSGLEQLELADPPPLLDALLVARDPGNGEVQAVDLALGRADGSIATLLDFRLDARRRSAITQRVLDDHPGGVPADTVRAIADSLSRGEALLAVLLREPGPTPLDDVVARAGGRLVLEEPVTASMLAEVAERLPGGP